MDAWCVFSIDGSPLFQYQAQTEEEAWNFVEDFEGFNLEKSKAIKVGLTVRPVTITITEREDEHGK